MARAPFLFFFFLLLSVTLQAQVTNNNAIVPDAEKTDTVVNTMIADSVRVSPEDTIKKKVVFQPNPKKAGLYSAVFPGAGQLYNRQYWKLPVIYAGFGVAAYFINDNYQAYNRYRTAYIATIDSDPNTISTEPYDSNQLKQLQDQFKQYVDLTVLLTSVGYIIQVMDAVVFAHLKNFDVSRDITMRMKPVTMPNGGLGFGLAFNFK